MPKTAEHEVYVAPSDAQKRDAGEVLAGIGRLNRDAWPRTERGLIAEHFLGVSIRVDRRHFHSGGPWIGFSTGYRLTARDLGTVFMYAEGSLSVDPDSGDWSCRIPVEVTLESERRAVWRRMSGDELLPHHEPDPLRAARGLERVDPEPVTGLVVDHGKGLIRAEPDVGVEVELIEIGPSMTCAEPDDYFELIHAVVLNSLGLREIEADTAG